MVSHIYTLTGSNLEFPLKYEYIVIVMYWLQLYFNLGICFIKDNSVLLTCAGMTSALHPAILTPAYRHAL